METVTDEDASKRSKIELRKLKLAEYLAAKGRLKAPNPKPYLKEKPVTKKHAENNQKSKTTAERKENCGINGTNIKEVKRVKTLAEDDKNTSSKEGLGMSSLAKAQTQLSSNSRNASREGRRVLRTQSNKTASLQNPKKPHNAEKTAAPFKRTRSQRLRSVQPKAQPASQSHAANTSKSSLVSICNPSQSARGVSALRSTDQSRTKTDIQSTSKKLPETSVKSTSAANLTSQRPMNTTETKMQRNGVSKTQVKPMQQPRSPSAVHSRNRKPNPSTNRSDVNRRKDTFFVDATKTKSNGSDTIRATRASTSSTRSKPANREAAAAAVIKNKQLNNAAASTKPAGRSSRSCVLPQTTSAPPELHRPAKISSQAKPAVQRQTPKSRLCPGSQGVRTAPVDGEKKPTAAQEDRLRKLQDWRDSRGITYKRPPMPVHLVRRKTVSALPQPFWTSRKLQDWRDSRGITYKRPPMPVHLVRRKTVSALPQPFWTSMENEDEVHDVVFAVDRSLDDCIQLLQQGFPAERVRDVLSRVPMAQKFAKYWICQARLMERAGNLEVLPMFQEAIRVVREPVDELRSVVFEILKKRQIQGLSLMPKECEAEETGVCDEEHTPKPISALISGARGDSSVVKYKITATPGGKRSQRGAEAGQVDGHEIRFFTPVRRSVRIERSARRYPTALLEHEPCVTSLCELAGERQEEVKGQSSPVYVYRENEALTDRVHITLVYPEEEET
ncbi:cytoskeleton-associated protein 2-like [Sinocyclocheilus rhinocerous]|uniref:cytoskeleton-associated protein 2-like n=1 Tax=Sinocyclocheilus rhinocerous TaxID=307959 RepID=UPI0007BA3DF0|nr:PREDICTED: cytoskeleton-associated protein 2-like [Sinocyclocheilus rhinocerous]